MASEGGGKIKNKKSSETSKPYARRQSLIGRVTDSVKDMLAPSWLVDLVSSVRKPSPPSSPSQTEDLTVRQDAVQSDQSGLNHMAGFNNMPKFAQQMSSPVVPQPATPQMHFQSHVQHKPQQAQTPSTVEAGNRQFPHFNKFPSLANPINGDEDEELDDHSWAAQAFPGASNRKEYQKEILQLNDHKIAQLRKDLAGSVTPSRELEEQMHSGESQEERSKRDTDSFLWTSEVKPKKPTKPQPSAKSSKPSFNVSIFGSAIASPERSSLFASQSLHESTYYPGRTTFGGAASHRRSRASTSSPYQTTPIRKQVVAKPLNTSLSRPGVTSSTAKKILDTLERMSTPLNDVKKMPSYSSNMADSPLTFTPSSYRRRSIPAKAIGTNLDGPPVRGLQTPTAARIGKNLARPPIHQNEPSKPVVDAPKPSKPKSATEANTGRSSGKMKRDKGGAHYSRAPDEDDEEVEIPDLPTGFTLPSNVLSGFKIDIPVSKPVVSTAPREIISPVKSTSNAHVSHSPTISTGFTFSSPIPRVDQGVNMPGGSASPVEFTFSSPLNIDSPLTKVTTKTTTSSFAFGGFSSTNLKMKSPKPVSPSLNDTTASTLVQGSVMAALENDNLSSKSELKTGSVLDALGIKKQEPKELKTGSVMDILGKGKSASDKQSSSSSLSGLFKKPEGSWECPTCMINNGADIAKCAACSTAKPGDKSERKEPVTSSQPSLSSMFGKPAGSWECPTCMIQNKSESAKCVACETSKPGSVAQALSTQPSLSSMFAKPSGSWECPTCMIQNKNEASKCIACETSKPGSGSMTSSSTQPSLSSMFGKPAGSWECPTCMIQNKSESAKCAACETSKPGSSSTVPVTSGSSQPSLSEMFKKPEGDWECDTCMVQNKANANKCIACETYKPGFKPSSSFSSSGQIQLSAGGGFKFGGNLAGSKSLAESSFKVTTSADTTTNSGIISGGFQFKPPANAESNKLATTSSPKTTSATDLNPLLSGGFKFSTATPPTSDKPSSTPQFGNFEFGSSTPSSTSDNTKAKESKAPEAGGFSFSVPKDTTANGAGGFKFGASSEIKPFATVNSLPTSKESDAKSSTSNEVKLLTSASPLSTTVSSVNFASINGDITSKSQENNNKPVISGFQFGSAKSETDKPDNKQAMSTFQFGSTKSDDENKSAMSGFQFESAKSDTDKSENKPALSGFQFGSAKSETDASESKPALSGFQFGSAKSEANKSENAGPKMSQAPAFSFAAPVSSTPDSTKTSQNNVTSNTQAESKPASLFMFGAAANKSVSSNSLPLGAGSSTSVFGSSSSSSSSNLFGTTASSKSDAKPSTGGFVFGTTPDSSKTAGSQGIFGFNGSQESTKSAGFTLGKRSNDEANGSPPKKREVPSVFGSGATGSAAFGSFPTSQAVFGSGVSTQSSSTPAFGGAVSSSAPFSFGQTNNATVAAPASTGGFAFGQSAPASAAPASTPAAVAPTVPSSFNFSTTPSSFNFGGGAPATETFKFGAGNPPPSNNQGNPGVNPAAPHNPFSTFAQPGAQRPRLIKKATRKLRK